MTLALIESIPKSRSFNRYSVWRKITKHSVMIKKSEKDPGKKTLAKAACFTET